MRTSKNQSKGTRGPGNLPRKALSCLASAALASAMLPAAALATDAIGYAEDDAPPPGASGPANPAAPDGFASSPYNSALDTPTAPPFAVQTKTYNGTAQGYDLEGYQITYSQDGKSVMPRNAGSYDVTIGRPASESDPEASVTLVGGLVIERAKLTIAADNKSMAIGEKPPAFTYTCTGLFEGDELGFAPTFSCKLNPKVPGSYQIGITAITSVNGTPVEVTQTANYDIELIPGTLEVFASTTTTPPAPPAEPEPKPMPSPEPSAPTTPAAPSTPSSSPTPAPAPTPPEASATPSSPDAAEAPQRPAAGDIATIGAGVSLLRFAIVTPADESGKGGTATVIGCAKSAEAINVPAKAEIGGAAYRVISISAGAFKNSKKLERVAMAKSVTAIGARSLDGCAKLTSLTIGSGVKRIGSRALRGCKSLTTVTIAAKRLPQSAVNNLVAGSRVKTVVVRGSAASLKRYQKQFSREKCGKKGIVVRHA